MLFDSFHLTFALKNHLEALAAAQKREFPVLLVLQPGSPWRFFFNGRTSTDRLALITSAPELPNRAPHHLTSARGSVACVLGHSACPGASPCTEQVGRLPLEDYTWSLCPLWRQGPDGWLVLQPRTHAGQPLSKRMRGLWHKAALQQFQHAVEAGIQLHNST